MKNRFLFPVAVAAVSAGTGFLAFSLNADAEQNQPERQGQTKQYRFEFKNDGSGPRFWQNGKELENPLGQGQGVQDNPMAELLRRLLENHGSPQGGSEGMAELLKQFGQLNGDELDNDAPHNPRKMKLEGAEPPLNPERLLEEMFRRMGGRGGNGSASGLGFGPEAREELPRTSKHHLSALAEWRPLVAQTRQSTVRVLKKDRQVALATVVSSDGYALTKASEVEKGDFEVEFTNGKIVPAKVVDMMKAYDLALIKVEATGLVAAKFSDTDPPVGTLIAAVSHEEDPTGVGVISAAARSLDERSKGALGIVMDAENAPPKGVLIGTIVEGGAAERAGMQPGDIILSVNSEEIASFRQLRQLISSLKPEQKVKVQIERQGKPQELELSLGNRGDAKMGGANFDQRRYDPTAQMGSNLSKNATGYPNALQSDLALQAEDAGGPVIDVNGTIVGLNIARAERVSTFLIPGRIMNALLINVQSGQFSLSKDADTLNSELREINTTIQKAQDAMKKAEQERDAAMKALEKIQKK